ncbi:CUB and sushi domain-containing protein 3-like [Mercenaria mercenaria]|uniref:CUB and sushi domain-containing protein 3-like n=1 Tax=Mercenaria mercenaria TaxID=6596 RepID=UPI00234EF0AC|nr:CUB and sushi domain-containing protein 3-like [Mercenaria mercenaria]
MVQVKLFFVTLFVTCVCVNASHFRGAIFTWTPSEDGSTITISFRISWRRTYAGYWCNDSIITNGTLIGGGNLVCSSGCNDTIGSLFYQCTDYSEIDDWSTGRHDITYTVTSTQFSFSFSSCCWISTLVVGKDGNWNVQASVDLSVRSDTGRINSSPTVEMTPVLNLQHGCSYTVKLPVGDVDGDIVRCRWATGLTECSDVCNGFIGAVLDEEKCTITYTADKNLGLYAAALQIEDYPNILSTTALSSIPLQFIARIYAGNNCDDVPEFIQPTPEDNACFALDVGDTYNVTIKARGQRNFHRITTISAIGMVRSLEIQSKDSSMYYVELNVTWTPTISDSGKDHSLCFYATDNSSITSTMRCIKLPVSVSGPTPLRVERVGLTNTWIIIIDQTFERPTDHAFIEVFETSTNTKILSVDASTSSDVVFDPIRRQINVTFQYVFDIEEDYHVSIPSGLVEGYVSCGALSVPVNDSSFWKIEVDCGELTIANGIVLAPDGTDYPHSVTYMCNIGHDLVGTENRTCTANGTWTESEPYCKPRDCGNFPELVNGYVSTNSTIYNTTVNFFCITGYEVSGNASMFCDHTPAWSSPPPVCVIIDCGAPTYLENGNVSALEGTTYQKWATYSCNSGYDLMGSSSRQCLINKIWSDAQPFCSPKDCGLLGPPVNGNIDMTNTTVGNTVTYSCGIGFILHGDSKRECLHSGFWNGSNPTCKVADCGQLNIPFQGSVIASGSTYGKTGVFSCNVGYELQGHNFTECQASGSWSNPEPSCSLIDCGELPPIDGGVYLFNGTTYGEILTAECNVGYDLHGSSLRQCQSSGNWSGSTATCTIKDCGPLQNPVDGSVLALATSYGTSVTYSCKTGYSLTGGDTRVCQADGFWSGTPPTCQIKDCQTLPPPDNGKIYIPKTTYGSYALYICDEEYHIVGSNNRRCMSDGIWSDQEPVCELTDCGNLTAPLFGEVTFNSTFYKDQASFICYTGYELIGDDVVTCQSDNTWSGSDHVCVLKDCGFLDSPENGIATATAATYGTIETFTCNEGFELIGDDILVCTANGTWNGTVPICLIKDCGDLLPPSNGDIFVNKTTFGSEALYSCRNGFTLNGVENRTCLSNATWSESDPFCKIKDCGTPSAPENGRVTFYNTTYSSECVFSCNTGYYFKGFNLSVCSESGTWNNSGVECIIKDCGNLSLPPNGVLDINSTTYGSAALFSCTTGYDLKGDTIRSCTESGYWDNDYPECVIKDCGNLTDPVDGRVSYLKTTYQSTASYTCAVGYNLVGLNITQCTASGAWSPAQPLCEIVDCGALPAPTNGNNDAIITTYGETVNFTCDTGYALFGNVVRTCLETGLWSGTMTTCKIKDCGFLAAPEDGTIDISSTVYQSKVVYKCNIAYDLIGVSSRECLSNGSWSQQAPLCRVKDCGTLHDIENGIVYIPFTTFGSVASYICNKGYHVVGDVTRLCLADGVWDGETPFCELTVCPEMPPPENGHVDHNSTLFEDEMIFRCDTGYTLFGKAVVVCQKDGTWSDYEHNCTIKDCGQLLPPTNGTILISSTTYLSTAEFQCNEGYDLNGDSIFLCRDDGLWNGTTPFCKIRECKRLQAPDHGNVSSDGTEFGSWAIYNCDAGYNLAGSRNSVCLSDRNWSTNTPKCQIKDCGNPLIPGNGDVDFGNTTFGSVSYYSCIQGYDIIGGNTSICTEFGNWSNGDIKCTIKDCGHLSVPPNTRLDADSTTFGSIAFFSCEEGYNLYGNSERHCSKEGVWNNTSPSCIIKDCGTLTDPENGLVIYNASTYGSVAVYRCDVGYNLTGSNKTECSEGGFWTDSKPSCPIVDCGPLDHLAYGNIDINVTTYGASVNYSCDVGYDLIGVKSRVCLANGDWDGYDTYCEIKDCGSLVNPVDGIVSVSSTVYEGIATYNCSVGFDLWGENTRKCSADGIWDKEPPRCLIKDCGSLSNPVNGEVYVPISTYNAYALYVCYEGYHIRGTHTRKCTPEGLWSKEKPICEQTDCGNPPSPVNGEVTFNGTVYESEAKYMCYTGYELVGEESIVCEEDEKWSETGQSCMLTDCGSLEAPEDGDIKGTTSTYQSIVTFSCSEGFDLSGDEKLVCTADGKWNGSTPVCRIKDCGSLPELQNGKIVFNKTTFGSEANYICDVGYSYMGDFTRICRSNATWSETEPLCQIKDCKVPSIPSNGEIYFDNTTYGSVIYYLCDVGYNMKGENVSVCTENGQWNNTETKCVIKDCGNLSNPENGELLISNTYYGSMANFSCNTGFTLHGYQTRTCLETGNWSNDNPLCVVKDCGELSGPTNGSVYLPSTTYGAVAVYICDTGYDVFGDVTRVCQEDGIWDGNDPTCELTDCEPLHYPLNGRVIAESRNFGDIAMYVCDTGYTLVGNDTRECLINTSWSNTEPVCEIKDCGPLTGPDNGHVVYGSTTYGSKVSVTCDEGYDLTGEYEGICEHTGTWSINISECKIKDCGTLTHPENGRVKTEGTVFRSTASVICNTGYTPDIQTLQCSQTGTWDGKPSCIIKDCGSIDAPDHGSVSYSSTTYKSLAVFECDVGYDLEGVSNKTCQHDGTWTNGSAECKIRSCGYPNTPENGFKSLESDEYKSVVTFSCATGFNLVGKVELTCLENGTWDGLEPLCNIKDCRDPVPITNGQLQFTATTFGSSASYICDIGYIMIGQPTIECSSDGMWQNRPMCKIKKCGELQSPENGKVFMSSNTYGALAIFSCNDGYWRDGNQLSECLDNSTWSNTETICEIKDCGKPLSPTNGNVSYNNTTYESVARFSCNNGYNMNGGNLMRCSSDGLWNGSVPDCIIKACNNIDAPANGDVSITTMSYGATAVVSCISGYDLVGETHLKCTENGSWSDEVPSCVIKDCGLVGNLTNGEVSNGSTVYGSVKTFSCDNGYEMLGSNMSNCLENGSWSDNPPKCNIKTTSASAAAAAYWIIGGSTGFIIFVIAVSIIAVTVSRVMGKGKQGTSYIADNSINMDDIKLTDNWQHHNGYHGSSFRQSDWRSFSLRMTPGYLSRTSGIYEA